MLSLLLGCASTTATVVPPPPVVKRVLFIGNSLTYTNDLPHTVAAIATAAGMPIEVAVEAEPGLALIDHLTGGSNALATLHRGPWDYVVLQQGPTPAGICRDSLVLWTQQFDTLVRAAGGTTAMMMPWPAVDASTGFDEVRESFLAAAAAVGGVFLPAGEAWRAAWRENPTLELYGKDGFHPSSVGSFLAALTVHERLTGRDARTLPLRAFRGLGDLTLPPSEIQLLQRAAHAANIQFPARPTLRLAATELRSARPC
ncbi:MAG: hypothetical protein ABJC19_09610 [Gemmatimonadota bacterium]